MMLLEIEPTDVKHDFQPGGMPTRCRDSLDHDNELDPGLFGGFTEPDTQRPVA
jgi:hypothetical protein